MAGVDKPRVSRRGAIGEGRPPIGPSIAVKLPRELIAFIDAHAHNGGITRSDLIREILTEWSRR